MIKTFTQTDLIRYLYLETTEEETREIDKALICDNELMTLYKDLCAMVKSLDDAQLQPSNQTVLNILSYARSVNEEKHS